jgi:hypothetical protein
VTQIGIFDKFGLCDLNVAISETGNGVKVTEDLREIYGSFTDGLRIGLRIGLREKHKGLAVEIETLKT